MKSTQCMFIFAPHVHEREKSTALNFALHCHLVNAQTNPCVSGRVHDLRVGERSLGPVAHLLRLGEARLHEDAGQRTEVTRTCANTHRLGEGFQVYDSLADNAVLLVHLDDIVANSLANQLYARVCDELAEARRDGGTTAVGVEAVDKARLFTRYLHHRGVVPLAFDERRLRLRVKSKDGLTLWAGESGRVRSRRGGIGGDGDGGGGGGGGREEIELLKSPRVEADT